MAGLLDLLSQTWPARLGAAAWDAAKLPGDVWAGRTDPMSPEALARANSLAGFMVGMPMTPNGALGSAARMPARSLPMDEASRMARATAQGYTTEAYKGLYPYDWNTGPFFAKGQWHEGVPLKEITEINSPNAPYAGFFSAAPDVANRFAGLFQGGGAVMPARLKFENPVVIDAGGKPAAAFQFDAIAREHGTQEALTRFRQAFSSESNHDGVILKNTADEGDVFVPRAPTQVRSRFAAFDPANSNSGNALGSGGGLPLPGQSAPLPDWLYNAMQAPLYPSTPMNHA